MRKNYFLFGIMLVLGLIVMDISAQVREVPVAPGPGTLNEAIKSDTTETGDRVDPENTVYVLQRGPEAYYLLEGTISNSGYPLTIKAEDGDGPRPFLQPMVVGDESARAFRPKADLTLMGLHVTNYDNLGGQPTRIIRASEDDITIIVDDCWFDRDGQSFIRVDNPGMNIQVTNTVVSNIGYPTSPDNGRGIDDRGNEIDTVIIENCTFYNISSRIIRDGGGAINYCRVSNNTFMNIGQHGITVGPVGTLEMNNNIWVNAGFMPGDAEDPNYVISVDSVGDVAPVVSFNKNIVYMDTTLVADFFNDTIGMPLQMNETFKMAVMEGGGMPVFYTEPFSFTDEPPFNDSLIMYDLGIDGLDQDYAPFWEIPELPDDGNGVYHTDVPYDFGYANALGYNLNGEEMPGGDPRWMAESAPFMGVDFEDSWETYLWGQFANDGDAPENMMVVANPDMSGANTTAGVIYFNVQAGGDPWVGAWAPQYGIMEFTEEKHHMSMMVHKSVITNAALKIEGGFDGAENVEVKVPNTVTGEWEELLFDFSAAIGKTYRKLVIFPDFPDTRTEGSMCYLDEIMIVDSPDPTGVDEEKAGELKLYPNPAVNYLTVEYPGMRNIMVRDVLGKLVQTLELSGEHSYTLSTSELGSGMYFVTVDADSGSFTTKFLKK